MNDSKLPHAMVGSLLAWGGWFMSHIAAISGVFAIVASCFTIWAAYEAAMFKRKLRKKLDKEQ